MSSLPFFRIVQTVGIRGYFSLHSALKKNYIAYNEDVKRVFLTLDLEQKISFLEEAASFTDLDYLADQETLVGILEYSLQRELKLRACSSLKLVPHIYTHLDSTPLDQKRPRKEVKFSYMVGGEPPGPDLIQRLQSLLPAPALQFYVQEYLLPVMEKAMLQPDGYMIISQNKRPTGNSQQEFISSGQGYWQDNGNYHGRNAGLTWEQDGEYRTKDEFEVEEVRTTKSHQDYRLKAFNLSLALRKLYEPKINVEELRQTFIRKDERQFPFNSKRWIEKYLTWE